MNPIQRLQRWRFLLRLRAWRRIERWLTEECTLYGLPVYVFNTRSDKWDNDLLFQKVEAALGLVAAHRPIWIRRMQRDLARISVRIYPVCRAAFTYEPRVLLLDAYFVATFPLQEIASSIVHEGTHARIHARLPELAPECRGREERICRRAELRFVLRLPDGDEQAAWLREAILASDEELAPEIDWNEPYRDAAVARIEELGAPAWLKSWLLRKVEQRYPSRSPASESQEA